MVRRDKATRKGFIRDQRLLDSIEKLRQRRYGGNVWRSVRAGADPLACWRSGGRWDDGTFDVLYTSETREAAVAERRFHLYQGQPLPPSKVRYELFELRVSLKAVIMLDDLDALGAVGLDVGRYGQLAYVERAGEYPRSQEIAEACASLGADGILVPSSRDQRARNLVVFCEQETLIEKTIVRSHGLISFDRV
jgi:RES domain-containing protein